MRITNALASLFIEENLKLREQQAEGTSEFLESQVAEAKTRLEKQEQALKEFKEMRMGALPGQMDANLRTLDRFQLELQTSMRRCAMQRSVRLRSRGSSKNLGTSMKLQE